MTICFITTIHSIKAYVKRLQLIFLIPILKQQFNSVLRRLPLLNSVLKKTHYDAEKIKFLGSLQTSMPHPHPHPESSLHIQNTFL